MMCVVRNVVLSILRIGVKLYGLLRMRFVISWIVRLRLR